MVFKVSSLKPLVGDVKLYPRLCPSNTYSITNWRIVISRSLLRVRTYDVEEFFYELGYAAIGRQTALSDLPLVTHPLGLTLEPFLLVFVVLKYIIQRHGIRPQIGLVHED